MEPKADQRTPHWELAISELQSNFGNLPSAQRRSDIEAIISYVYKATAKSAAVESRGDREVALDLIQTVLVEVCEHLGGGTLSWWTRHADELLLVAIPKRISVVARTLRRRADREVPLDEDLAMTPLERPGETDLIDEVTSLGLTPQEASVLGLRMDGLTRDEIAASIGVSVAKVKRLLISVRLKWRNQNACVPTNMHANGGVI